ncbi:MAG: MATE family efflux transporter [Kiritimatiellia bacterium]|nr:MATE family efflux transporter [Kiritimatiellia bacterium]
MKLFKQISFVRLVAQGGLFWARPNGCRDVLVISLPLVISMGSHTVMLFCDRLFLSRYSVDAIAAATPAGLLAFMFTCFFMGVVGFANTLIAQSVGAGMKEQVARSLWQAVYFAVFAGIILAALSFSGDTIFSWAGHPETVRAQENIYFRILMQGAIFALLHDALACFYSGQGLTRPIMFINLAGVLVNIPLDYVLIYGVGGFPEMGVKGAAIATILGHVLMLVLFVLLVFSRENNRLFGMWRQRVFDRQLFGKLIKYGAPAGIQFFVDMFAFTFFLMVVGRIGRDELAATNIAFAINTLAFMPMIGFSIAVSSLVGQAIGRGKPEEAVIATKSSLFLTMTYMWAVVALFVLFPANLCGIFRSSSGDPASDAAVQGLAVILLRFVALYSLVDGLNIIYSGALKGAGDTAFIGWTIIILSVGLIILPVTLAVLVFQAGLYTAWTFATLYVCALSGAFWWRFRQGRWKTMRIMEPRLPAGDVVLSRPGIPGAEEL